MNYEILEHNDTYEVYDGVNLIGIFDTEEEARDYIDACMSM